MADEKLNLEVILSASSQGVEGVAQKASLVQDAVEALNRVVPLGEKVLNAYSKTTAGLEKSFGGAASGAQKMAGTFETVRSEVLELDRRLQSAAETALSFGSQNIFGDAVQSARMTGEEARKVADYYEAIEINAKSAAKAILDAAEASQKLNNASAREFQLGSTDPKSFFGQANSRDASLNLKASETTWAKEAKLAQETGKALEQNMANLTRRFKEERDKQLSDAQRNNALEVKSAKDAREQELAALRQVIQVRSREQSQSLEAAQDTDRLNEQARAAELAALKQQILARNTGTATEEISRQEAHLPRLRYALHDVSTQMTVIGGAMVAFSALSFKAAVDYERSFANVIRTNDQLLQSQVSASRMLQEFIDLAGRIPSSFADLSEIGQLAGQLDVPTHALTDFTEAVAMFSATTGESIDTTATAFGRLDALLPGVQGNFQALGSSILNVGINSVATEGEIIKITTQLAGIGRQAGLTYDELVGLSGALASVGIQPELSRGTITRLFGQISRAVTLGGERLSEFGRIARMSGDEFASTWNSSPMQAVVSILQGLRDRGGEAEAALRAVGITSVRDVPAILRLAQTVDSVLVPALGDAAAGAEEASQLAENYGVIAKTVAARIQILTNNMQSLFAAMTDSTGPISFIVDVLNNLSVALRRILENPVIGFFAQSAVIATALLGVFTLLGAGVVRLTAGFLAFRTAMIETGVASAGLRGGLTALIGSISGVDAATLKTTATMRRFSSAVRGVSLVSLALVAVPIIGWLDGLVQASRNAVVDTQRLSEALSQLDVGITSSVSNDITEVIEKSLSSIGSATSTMGVWDVIFPVRGAVSAIRVGMNHAESELDIGLNRLTKKASSWFTADVFTGETSWLGSFLDPSIAQIEEFESAWISAWESATSETQKQAILDALEELQEGMSKSEVEAFKYNLSDLFDVIGDGVDRTKLLAESVDDARANFEGLQDTLLQIVDSVFETVNEAAALTSAMESLGAEYINLGAAASFSGDSMQDAIKTIVLQSGGAGAAAANLQILYDFILANTDATASELIYLSNAIRLLKAEAGGFVSGPTLRSSDFDGFIQGATRATTALRKTGSAARSTRNEIRTLLDYAGDLGRVWGRAFDIRFGSMTALDEITSTFNAMREAVDAAAKRIRDLKNDISGLQSDIALQEYFLSIAIEYGDTARAEKIEADLAKMRAELADKTDSLNSEQETLNKSLTGNTQNAIDNRKELTKLVKQYLDYLEVLASSGISQDELAAHSEKLRQDFIKQATALGYNRDELRMFESSFRDVARVINAVPFNVTTDLSNLDPALLAIQEFVDNANKSFNQLGSGIGGTLEDIPRDIEDPVRKVGVDLSKTMMGGYDYEMDRLSGMITAEAMKNLSNVGAVTHSLKVSGNTMGITLNGAIAGAFGPRFSDSMVAGSQAGIITASALGYLQARKMGQTLAGGIVGGLAGVLQSYTGSARTTLLGVTGFRQGGYTGPGGANEPAGIVHKGEYVIPKHEVNQATGLPYADALGRLMGGIQSRSTAPSRGSGGGTGAGVVDLSAGTIQALAHAVQTHIYLNGRDLADASAQSYANDSVNGRY